MWNSFSDEEYFIENSLTFFPPFLKKFFSKFLNDGPLENFIKMPPKVDSC